MCEREDSEDAVKAKERIELIKQKIAPMFSDDLSEIESDRIREWLLVDDEYGSAREKEQALSEFVTQGLELKHELLEV